MDAAGARPSARVFTVKSVSADVRTGARVRWTAPVSSSSSGVTEAADEVRVHRTTSVLVGSPHATPWVKNGVAVWAAAGNAAKSAQHAPITHRLRVLSRIQRC